MKKHKYRSLERQKNIQAGKNVQIFEHDQERMKDLERSPAKDNCQNTKIYNGIYLTIKGNNREHG